MRKYLRKAFVLLMVVAIMVPAAPVFAQESLNSGGLYPGSIEREYRVGDFESIPSSYLTMLLGIPVFIAEIEDPNDESAKEESRVLIESVYFDDSTLSARMFENERILSDAGIARLSDSQIEELFHSPVHSSTMRHFQQLVDDGMTVYHITLFVPSKAYASAASVDGIQPLNQGSWDWWFQNTHHFGIHNGFSFRFSEARFHVGTNWFNPRLQTTISWSQVGTTLVEGTADILINNATVSTMRTISGTFAGLFGAINSPFQLNINQGGSHVLYRVTGDSFIRTVFIENRENRAPINSIFVDRGSVRQFSGQVLVETRRPTNQRPGGQFDFITDVRVSALRQHSTPGFFGNTQLWNSIIARYRMLGISWHDERLDINRMIVNMTR